MSFTGLSKSDWADMHRGIAEAAAYAEIPVVVLTVHEASSGDFDALYEEGASGTVTWDRAPAIGCWVRYYPREEVLRPMGLLTGADVLLFIPSVVIVAWNATYGRVFTITDASRFVLNGVTYNVEKVRGDPLAVGDGSMQDQVGLYVTGNTKPN